MVDEGFYSERDYVAPTVFKKAGLGASNYNYYGTVNEAIVKYKYLNNIAGGANIAPEGYVSFSGTGAQTFGINCDFFMLSNGKWVMTTYKYLRAVATLPPIIFRFYTREGAGAFYAIYDKTSFGMSATSIDSVSAEKLNALDGFYREVQLLKYRYNNLAAFANDLSKRTLSQTEQRIFNETVLKLQNMQAQMTTIKGIEISFNSSGVVGVIPFLIIAIILIVAAASAWTIISIVEMKEKTKRINDSYDLSQWVATKKQEIAQQVQAGAITPEQASAINKTLDNATDTANQVAANSSKPGGLISELTSLVKWGVLGLIIFEGAKLLKPKQQTATA